MTSVRSDVLRHSHVLQTAEGMEQWARMAAEMQTHGGGGGDATFGGMSSSCRNQELRSNFSMRVGRGGFSEVGSEFWRGISTL